MISIRKINVIFPLEHKNVRGDRHVKKMYVTLQKRTCRSSR